MTTTTTSLTDFLEQRIAEDEAVARAAVDADRPGTHWHWVTTETDTPVVSGEEELALQEQSLSLRTVEEFEVASLPGATIPAFIIYEEDGSGRPEALVHIARHDPARVLAECEAKRRIVELHKVTHWGVSSGPWNEPPRNGAGCASCFEWHRYPDLGRAWEEPAHSPCPTLRALASVYSNHPDFDPAWA